MPGLFTTRRGWTDPFALLQQEDPTHSSISSVLAQAGVRPVHSGALIVGAGGEIFIEGRAGTGDALMLGENVAEPLPNDIVRDVQELHDRAAEVLGGSVRFEWVHDGDQAWVVQLHRGVTESSSQRITPGEANEWVEFDVERGLPALRSLLEDFPRNAATCLQRANRPDKPPGRCRTEIPGYRRE